MSGHFRELEVWQAAMRLAGSARALAEVLGDEAGDGLAATLRTAAATIPEQIARGHAEGDLAVFAPCLAVARQANTQLAGGLRQARALVAEAGAGHAADQSADHGDAFDHAQALADEVGRMLARLHQAITGKLQADAATAASQQR